ncbi:MAG: carboxypeptidase, partial [Acidimicrobiaceae bacterium]|nr:carboxypeptidase [Acidimicrobiaceae bacterium]
MYKSYDFDRFLRYEELAEWLNAVAGVHPDLVTIETYGQSFEGRDLLIATITDSSTGSHDTKPAHWIDASIHAVELTATVAACRVLQRLVDGFTTGDEQMVRALQTRTFYIVPRANPDGAEWAMADTPKFRRSSVRPWPLANGHRMPGHLSEDIDGDGRILQMRIADPDGQWMPHPDDARLLIPVLPQGPPAGTPRYRVLAEGTIESYDGFTVPKPRPPEGLDMNRN